MIKVEILNIAITGLIAVLLGILGAYFTNWEKNIYYEYLTYILPPIGITAALFFFIDTQVTTVLLAIFIMGLSWYYSTKLWFGKK